MTRTVTMTDGSQRVSLSCTETAVLVRKALKNAFPGTKFSVRSDKYSGGASIRVSWTDGPKDSDVDKVVGMFAGADFDGMIDLKCYKTHWLHPDGTVTIAVAEGTEGSRGSIPRVIGDPQGPTATLVSFGADFVFTQREVSPEWREEILCEFEKITGKTVTRDPRDWQAQLPLSVDRLTGELYHMVEHETEYVNHLVDRYTTMRSR